MFYRYEHYMSISHMALIVAMEQLDIAVDIEHSNWILLSLKFPPKIIYIYIYIFL